MIITVLIMTQVLTLNFHFLYEFGRGGGVGARKLMVMLVDRWCDGEGDFDGEVEGAGKGRWQTKGRKNRKKEGGEK